MKKVRCAIYTRKSSEDGLEQDFNSLDAQREACAAYVMSQASEGWSLLPECYDDGGVSGGTLERPALQRLLEDIELGKIDIVVLYKVDRLTRSLLDFAKLVERFDKANTSFVSITQSFNTTTSMGRLTLNMLLSFAQFEREVTAERIRDKIAASKAKGMWMGGTPPLGYRPDGRSLAIIDDHAALVRDIFRRYLEVGNVRLLAEELQANGIMVPLRHASTGRAMGGRPFARGHIYKLLSNPNYVGEIHHRGAVHRAKHEAIIDHTTWDAVQQKLANNAQGETLAPRAKAPSLLAGQIVDQRGEPLVATHANKGKVRYRYYVSRSLQHAPGTAHPDTIRIPAREIEAAVISRIRQALDDPLTLLTAGGFPLEADRLPSILHYAQQLADAVIRKDRNVVRGLISRVTVSPRDLMIEISAAALAEQLGIDKTVVPGSSTISLTSAVRLTRTGRAMQLVHHNGQAATAGTPDPGLVQLLVKARGWWAQLSAGDIDIATIARNEKVSDSWVSRVIRMNFLAPAIAEAILAGTQPVSINAASLRSANLPIDWTEQLMFFGM